jgi:hypothetical protein
MVSHPGLHHPFSHGSWSPLASGRSRAVQGSRSGGSRCGRTGGRRSATAGIPGLESVVYQGGCPGRSVQAVGPVGPLACCAAGGGVDDEALGVAVDFGAAGEQAGVGDAEIEQGGLYWARYSHCICIAACFLGPPPGNGGVAGTAISLTGDSRPSKCEGPARRPGPFCHSPDCVRCPATGLGHLRIAPQEQFHTFAWRPEDPDDSRPNHP